MSFDNSSPDAWRELYLAHDSWKARAEAAEKERDALRGALRVSEHDRDHARILAVREVKSWAKAALEEAESERSRLREENEGLRKTIADTSAD